MLKENRGIKIWDLQQQEVVVVEAVVDWEDTQDLEGDIIMGL